MPKKRHLSLLPVRNSVVFPGGIVPLIVGRPDSLKSISNAFYREDKLIAIIAQKDPEADPLSIDHLFSVGTLCAIKSVERIQGDGVQVVVSGIKKVTLLGSLSTENGLTADFIEMNTDLDGGPEVEALERSINETVTRADSMGFSPANVSLQALVDQVRDPIKKAYLICSLFGLNVEKAQRILEANKYSDILSLVNEYLNYEMQVLELKSTIANKTERKIGKENKEFILRQQLRTIQNELGELNPVESEIEDLRQQIEEKKLPELVNRETKRELSRLQRLSPNAAEYQIIRGFLEVIIELPWTHTPEPDINLNSVKQLMDADHYDLEDVKERILEYLAIQKLNPAAKTPILCFVGPPGVGKTSLGQSIAKALHLKFERLSLGGVYDESELRGHRRTYIGAMPGRIIQAIRRAGALNPVLMLDEIDKLGRDFHGDPAAALLEILDPKQNSTFHDNFLGLPFDLSKVFFITTANITDSIPRALVDRMEILRLSGYTDQEKLHIAKKFLLPAQVANSGLQKNQINFTDEAVKMLIRHYTRESGVRNLESNLSRVISKLAFIFVSGKAMPKVIGQQTIENLLGPKKFLDETIRLKTQPGVAAGLAWTETGGEMLYVEASYVINENNFILTGHLGDVMKESAMTAKTCALNLAKYLNVEEKRLSGAFHVHVPAGAIPKDGPSAGITIAMAIFSLVTGLPIDSETAMTGEISLAGLVLPVGGIKEKILAAHRIGMKRVIMPLENKGDLTSVPIEAKKDITFIFVRSALEIVNKLFPKFDLEPTIKYSENLIDPNLPIRHQSANRVGAFQFQV